MKLTWACNCVSSSEPKPDSVFCLSFKAHFVPELSKPVPKCLAREFRMSFFIFEWSPTFSLLSESVCFPSLSTVLYQQLHCCGSASAFSLFRQLFSEQAPQPDVSSSSQQDQLINYLVIILIHLKWILNLILSAVVRMFSSTSYCSVCPEYVVLYWNDQCCQCWWAITLVNCLNATKRSRGFMPPSLGLLGAHTNWVSQHFAKQASVARAVDTYGVMLQQLEKNGNKQATSQRAIKREGWVPFDVKRN